MSISPLGCFFNTLLSLLIYKIVDENICSVSNFSKFAIFFLIILINDAYEEITTPVFGSSV